MDWSTFVNVVSPDVSMDGQAVIRTNTNEERANLYAMRRVSATTTPVCNWHAGTKVNVDTMLISLSWLDAQDPLITEPT